MVLPQKEVNKERKMRREKIMEEFLVESCGAFAPEEAYNCDETVAKWEKSILAMKGESQLESKAIAVAREMLLTMTNALTVIYMARDVNYNIRDYICQFHRFKELMESTLDGDTFMNWLDQFIAKLERLDSKLTKAFYEEECF